ncbi:MAG TPA: VCBS repeat-containing protein [Polyangiaceae bacterium]|nr:VCBS repeat-containing protein [Polyangiaceae bacterium]
MGRRAILSVIGAVTLAACSDDSPTTANAAGGSGGRSSAVGGSSSGGASPAKGGSGGDAGAKGGATALEPACQVGANPSSSVQKPELIATLFDRWHEAWLASPAVVDLDADGVSEIIVPRDELLLIWHLDGSLVRRFELPGRIWASPVVADLDPSRPGLELAVASRQQIAAWDAQGNPLSGFPFTWRDEMRSLAAADIDGDGGLELVAVTTSDLESGGQTDILIAVHANGKVVNGFPPNTTGHSGCDDACYVHAGYDQNVALGDVDGDGIADILAPQDNSYVSLHHGDGRAFDAAPIFKGRQKFLGIRFMLDYADAQQGYAEDEENSNQAHFTNTAPAIVDVDRDGKNDLVMLGSVQNAAQSDRERGVVLFVVHQDGTRPAEWVKPFHAPEFLDGLWDAGDNIVAATNQVTVLELDPAHAGYEFVFAGFDGKIHAVTSSNEELWQYPFTTRAGVLTGGVIAADLSRDGRPEIVFNSYSTAADQGALFVLSSAGALLHRIPLPGRGAMPVPTAADIDGDGQLEIIVSLKDAVDKQSQVQVYAVPGSGTNCMPWPTGRRDLRRSGLVQ